MSSAQWYDINGNEVLNGVLVGGGGAAVVQTAYVDLSSAQILALNSTPVAMVAAPGANKALVPIYVCGSLAFGTTQYATNVTLAVGNPTVGSLVSFSNSFLPASSSVLTFKVASNLNALALVNIVNQPLNVFVQTGDPTAGDSTLRVFVTYQLVSLA